MQSVLKSNMGIFNILEGIVIIHMLCTLYLSMFR